MKTRSQAKKARSTKRNQVAYDSFVGVEDTIISVEETDDGLEAGVMSVDDTIISVEDTDNGLDASAISVDESALDVEDVETVCHVCEAEFLDESELKRHVFQVHLDESNGKTICRLCCAFLNSGEQFVTHFLHKHVENVSFCYYCYRVFTDSLSREHHELKHCPEVERPSFKCSQCTKIFNKRLMLQNHEYAKHNNSNEGFMLNAYFSLLSSVSNMKIEKFIDAICRRMPFDCVNCGNYSPDLCDYITHLKLKNCKSVACNKCFNVYKKKHSIFKHILKHPRCQNHINHDRTPEKCPKCDKYFNVIDMIDHREVCKALKCAICSIVFDSISDLADHRVAEHKVSVSLETCKFCKKEFVGMFNLKKHMKRAHKDVSLYKYRCVYCDTLFMHPNKLFGHYFSSHREISPYTCKICKSDFRLRKNFTVHIKLHHNSVGFVEFDENLHVIFTDKKSRRPYIPQASDDLAFDYSTEGSDSDLNMPQENPLKTLNSDKNQPKDEKLPEEISESVPEDITIESNDTLNQSDSVQTRTEIENPSVEIISEQTRKRKLKQTTVQEIRRRHATRMQNVVQQTPPTKKGNNGQGPDNNVELTDDSSEDQPLSNVRNSLLKNKTKPLLGLKKRIALRDKKAKLTCKWCNKYCYTYQNYHHHMSLHEKRKPKRCIKCQEQFMSRAALSDHMEAAHSSSKLIDTLKSLLEKRKTMEPANKSGVKPAESFKSLLEKRRKVQLLNAQNRARNNFLDTIKKVDFAHECQARITAMSDHGISVKNFIENFRPDTVDINISNSVTIKTVKTPVNREPLIKMKRFSPDPPAIYSALRYPVKFTDTPSTDTKYNKVKVKLVQQLITKPKLVNMTLNERIPTIENYAQNEYCNTFADDTDYTQYKTETPPEVAHEIMVGNHEDAHVPNTRRFAQEVVIPHIPKQYGDVRIAHLTPESPYYKIVKAKKLIKGRSDSESETDVKDSIKLPDGTELVTVKNPYAHLIPNDRLQGILKAQRNKYYTPRTKNIKGALVKALNQSNATRQRKSRKRVRTQSVES